MNNLLDFANFSARLTVQLTNKMTNKYFWEKRTKTDYVKHSGGNFPPEGFEEFDTQVEIDTNLPQTDSDYLDDKYADEPDVELEFDTDSVIPHFPLNDSQIEFLQTFLPGLVEELGGESDKNTAKSILNMLERFVN